MSLHMFILQPVVIIIYSCVLILQVLEIIDDKARVIRNKTDRYSELQAAAYT